jgi:EAL domain-containing protein (putative c-di-GMP-specific phosphodiesterase class I)
MGHDVGDDLLVAMVSRLRLAAGDVRPLLSRLGGDEFLALFESVSDGARQAAEDFAVQALAALQDPFDIGGSEIFLTASVGIASTADADADASTLLSNAAAAMHETKAAGGDGQRVFGEAMHQQVVERMTTEHSLHRALDRRELTLFYQPVVAISGTGTIAFEALIRWEHPEQGLVPPARFIPVAEESGLIIPIGAWVLEEACNQLFSWRQSGCTGPSGSVEVNLSARQIDHPELVATVESILETTGLPPENLTLEITESALMRDVVSALQVLQALKSLGVSLAIDDFGTGYSSLSYLQRFPLDTLKVDKSFVDELGLDQGTEIVAAVINLAHALGLNVIAEGVETEPQLQALQQLGCDYAQGFLFSRPVSAKELSENFALGA